LCFNGEKATRSQAWTCHEQGAADVSARARKQCLTLAEPRSVSAISTMIDIRAFVFLHVNADVDKAFGANHGTAATGSDDGAMSLVVRGHAMERPIVRETGAPTSRAIYTGQRPGLRWRNVAQLSSCL